MAEQGEQLKICFIGAGNVAWHLAPALSAAARITRVVSRHIDTARALADRLPHCTAATSDEGPDPEADLYIIAANDDAIAEIAATTPDYPGLWVHTSGSVGIEVFAGKKTRYGSLYPLQTFSRDIPVDVRRVPFFIEASRTADLELMRSLLSRIADRVQKADSRLRASLHVAAVFACNFANQMWADADTLLRAEGLDITFLQPLLEMTLDKLSLATPEEAMTGPARRGDLHVISGHLSRLSPEMRRTYAEVTRRILDRYHPGLSSQLPEE